MRKPIRSDRRHRTIQFCTCKSLFNSRPFLFLSSNHVMMSLCTHSAARQWPRLKFSLSFRNNYDLMTGLTISLGAGEFIPYEPRSFVVVSELKATVLYCEFVFAICDICMELITRLFPHLWFLLQCLLYSNHSWVRFSGFFSSIWASRCSRRCGVLRAQFAVSSFAYTEVNWPTGV